MSLGFVVETDKAHIIMFFRRSADTAAVPVGLLTAAIDIINVAKPEPQNVEPLITSMARRFNYDHKTVLALMERIRATARMFAHPVWPCLSPITNGAAQDTSR